jgi:hypothetical protein
VAYDTIYRTDGLVISLSNPSHGDLHNFDDGEGGFTYVPNEGFVGTDSFTYTLEDVETSLVATVTITVSGAATTTTASTTTTSSATSSSVEGSSTSAAAPLAVTGSGTKNVAVVGFVLVGAGAIFVSAARRERAAR